VLYGGGRQSAATAMMAMLTRYGHQLPACLDHHYISNFISYYISKNWCDSTRATEKILFPGNKRVRFLHFLERFKKYCSHPVEWRMKPGLLTFGFVSAQSQVFFNMLLRQSLAKSQNPRLRMATVFFKPL
jgi:hypothetical protein